MSPVLVNGRYLGVQDNGSFSAANTDPIPGGKLWTEAALTWNAMRLEALKDGILPWEFEPLGPNSSARSRAAQDLYWSIYQHGGNPAAPPYTSNHGWGIAVDVKTQRAVAWLYANAHRFGWSHDEGARVNEWWHWRYIGVSKTRLAQIKRAMDPNRLLRGLGPERKKAAGKLLYWRRVAIHEALSGKGPKYDHALEQRNHMRKVVLHYYHRANPGRQKRILRAVLNDHDGWL